MRLSVTLARYQLGVFLFLMVLSAVVIGKLSQRQDLSDPDVFLARAVVLKSAKFLKHAAQDSPDAITMHLKTAVLSTDTQQRVITFIASIPGQKNQVVTAYFQAPAFPSEKRAEDAAAQYQRALERLIKIEVLTPGVNSGDLGQGYTLVADRNTIETSISLEHTASLLKSKTEKKNNTINK